MFNPWLIVLGLVMLNGRPASAAHPTSSDASATYSLSWLPPATQTQSDVFDDLTLKAGYQVSLPSYPHTGLLAWARQRYHFVSNQPKALYGLMYEDLLIAQQLLNDKDLHLKRDGMRLALNARIPLLGKIDDKQLNARIYEGFLLPYLNDAYAEDWQDLSRQQIVEAASSAFAAIGETEKCLPLLRLYLQMEMGQQGNLNSADWSRGQLAQILAGQGQYEEAVHMLQSIHTANFAMKQLIPIYQAAWSKQKQGRKQTTGPMKFTTHREKKR